MSAALAVENLEVVYHHTIQVLRGLSLEVPERGIVALLGANGAGKTTTLKAVSGLLPLENGAIGAGHIRFRGEPIDRTAPHLLARRGIVHVREGRRVFEDLTVQENLVAATNALTGRSAKPDFEMVYAYFPRLAERRKQLAGYLSGGEQQMLAIGRALMSRPRLLLLDEPSMGLAPIMVERIFEVIRQIAAEGVTMLLVEQNARLALEASRRAYVLESGLVTISGAAADLLGNPQVRQAYLGE